MSTLTRVLAILPDWGYWISIITGNAGIAVAFAGYLAVFWSGIAAASTNNGIGIAGVGYNCKILPVKVMHGYDKDGEIVVSGCFWYKLGKAEWGRYN